MNGLIVPNNYSLGKLINSQRKDLVLIIMDGESLKIFKCKHCNEYIAIVKAKNTYIPINAKKDDVFETNTEYLRFEMRSHLLDCEGRRKDWQQVVKFYKAHPWERIDQPVKSKEYK